MKWREYIYEFGHNKEIQLVQNNLLLEANIDACSEAEIEVSVFDFCIDHVKLYMNLN